MSVHSVLSHRGHLPPGHRRSGLGLASLLIRARARRAERASAEGFAGRAPWSARHS